MWWKHSLLKVEQDMNFPLDNELFLKKIKYMGIYLTGIFQNLCDER